MNMKKGFFPTHQQFGTASGASCLQDTTKELLVRASSHSLLSCCYCSLPTRSRCFPSLSYAVCRSIIIRNRICCFCFYEKSSTHKLSYYSIFETQTKTNFSNALIRRCKEVNYAEFMDFSKCHVCRCSCFCFGRHATCGE